MLAARHPSSASRGSIVFITYLPCFCSRSNWFCEKQCAVGANHLEAGLADRDDEWEWPEEINYGERKGCR